MHFREESGDTVITIELSVPESPLLYWSELRKNWVLEAKHATRFQDAASAETCRQGLRPRFPQGVSGRIRIVTL